MIEPLGELRKNRLRLRLVRDARACFEIPHFRNQDEHQQCDRPLEPPPPETRAGARLHTGDDAR
jgi:hypothetical protein